MGWLSFLIAAFVYCSTIEPTASFWDCPEFISTGYKLEIGHPPGAPFFMLTANLFSQFVSDPSDVARMVNTMSALLSAATILFHHPSRAPPSVAQRWRDDSRQDDKHRGFRSCRRTYLYLQRHLLVQCSGGRGICLFVSLHRRGVLADTQAGGACRRASQRPLACAYHVYDRTVHRCPSAQPFVSSRHRACVLLPQVPQQAGQCRPQRLAHRLGHFDSHLSSRALWCRSWHRARGRMV